MIDFNRRKHLSGYSNMIMEIGNLEQGIALGYLILTPVFNYKCHLVYPKSTLNKPGTFERL